MNFQNIFLGILAVAVVVAIFVFAQGGDKSGSDSKNAIKVTMWGDVEAGKGLGAAISQFNQSHQKTFNVAYSYIKPELFEAQLIEAIADNKSPDLVLLSNSKILRLENKLQPIPYASLPISKYEQNYIDASRVFLGPTGSLGLPLLLDPMVIYWNHDMFTNSSIIESPKYWDDIINIQPKLTRRGVVAGTFEYSAIALGEFENITHAKDIISTILMQVGIPIVSRNQQGITQVSLDSAARTTGEPPMNSALRFYMDFANPMKTLYSWNRTQEESINAFLAEKLAIYIGRSSDYKILKERNPHLNFKLGQIPQMRGTNAEVTYAEVLGVSVVKAGKQKNNASLAMFALASDDVFISKWSSLSFLPPARKDLLLKPQSDAIMPYFYDAAIKSRSWLDPREDESAKAFKEMINGLSSGRFQVPSIAANFLQQELSTIVSKLPK